jgi:altronate dehydratase
VKYCLLLEHGCEKTHNDYIRHQTEQIGLDSEQLGWASVQLDGGIEKVLQKIEAWFTEEISRAKEPEYKTVGLESLRLGLVAVGPVLTVAGQALAQLTKTVVGAGGTVVVPDNTSLLANDTVYLANTLGDRIVQPSLAYGQRISTPGFYLMENPTQHWVETLTGLGATGIEIIVAYIGQHPIQSHPLIPVLQVTAESAVQKRYGEDLDLALRGEPGQWPDQILQLILDVISRRYRPKLHEQGNIDFQITRGLLGVSL